MARVLMLGIDPDDVDFSDPALPPGLNADTIRAGIAKSLDQLKDAGHDASMMYVSSELAVLSQLADRLVGEPVDVVTIGGGVTRPPKNTELFETLLNIIGRVSPTPRIALVMGPEHAPEAVDRVLR
jgi:hypothetical protein